MENGAGFPLVSIGVPIYNGGRYLTEALTSLRNQTYGNIEVIISDNGSTDGSEAICRRFCVEDARYTYHRTERNRGLPWNFNRTLELAGGPLFMWLAHDDYADPTHVAGCVAELESNPDAVLAFSRVELVGEHGQHLGNLDDDGLSFDSGSSAERVREFLGREVYQAVGWGAVIRTAELRAAGGLPDHYGGDVVLGMALAIRGRFRQAPDRLFHTRRHPDQMSKLQGRPIAEQVRAFTPDHAVTWAFPQWRLVERMLLVSWRHELPVAARLRCWKSVIFLWVIPQWRFFPYDIKRNLQSLRARTRQRAYRSSGNGT